MYYEIQLPPTLPSIRLSVSCNPYILIRDQCLHEFSGNLALIDRLVVTWVLVNAKVLRNEFKKDAIGRIPLANRPNRRFISPVKVFQQ